MGTTPKPAKITNFHLSLTVYFHTSTPTIHICMLRPQSEIAAWRDGQEHLTGRTGSDDPPVSAPVPLLWVQISATRRSVLAKHF